MHSCSSLAGVRAIVVGGRGQVGAAIADRLAAEGAEVAALDLPGARTDAGTASGGRIRSGDIDLTRPDDVARALDEAIAHLGGVDAVVCASGVTRQGTSLADETAEGWLSSLAVNLVGPFLVAQAVAPALSDGGSLCFISSSGADAPLPQNLAYGAGKAGLNHLARSLAAELAPRGVRVNAVSPGLLEFPMSGGTAAVVRRDGMDHRVPLGRLGTGADVSAAVAQLLRPESSWVTGQVIRVDGGMTLR